MPMQPGRMLARLRTAAGLVLTVALPLASAPAAAPSDDEVRVVLAEAGLGSRPLDDVAVSPDGRLLLVAGERVSVVELSTGRQIWAQDRLSGPVAWLGGSSHVLAWRDGQLLRVDLGSGAMVPAVGVPIWSGSPRALRLAAAADAPTFAVAQEREVRLLRWPERFKEPEVIGTWTFGADVQDLAIRADGAAVAAAAGDVHLLTGDGSRLLPARDALSLSFGERGDSLYVLDARDRLAAWPTDGEAPRRGRLLHGERRKQGWRLLAGELLGRSPARRVRVRSGDDGALLVTLDENGRVVARGSDGKIHDAIGGGLFAARARTLGVEAHGTQVAVGGGERAPTLQRWRPGEAPETVETQGLPALLDVEVVGRYALTLPARGDPWALDLETGHGLALPSGAAARIALSGGEHPRAAVATARGDVRIWEIGGEPVERATITGLGAPTGLALSPDGEALAVAERAEISLWSTTNGASRWRYPVRQAKDRAQLGRGGFSVDLDMRVPGAAPTLAWSPDGRLLAVDLRDEQGTVLLLDAESGAERGRATVEGLVEEGAAHGVRFDARGEALLVHHGANVELRAVQDLSRAPLQKTLLHTNVTLEPPRVLPRSDGGGILFAHNGRAVSAAWPSAPRPGVVASLGKVRAFEGPPHARETTDLALSDAQTILISTGRDGTLRFWDLAEERALAIVVPVFEGGGSAPASWTTLTPEGAFDPAGGAPSPDVYYVRGEASLGLEQLYDRYYRAELLPRALSREPGLADDQLASLLSTTRPSVTIEGLADGAVFDDACNTLVITASGGSSPVERLAVRVGDRVLGRELGEMERVRGQALVRQRVELCLPKTGATLTPIAYTRDGLQTTGEPRKVDLSGSGQPTIGPDGTGDPRPPTRPTLRVLAAGVSRYRNSEIDLQFAASDATELASSFEAARAPGYGGVEVVRLTDAEATRAAMLRAIAELQDRAVPEDTVVIFLSGHGVLGADGAWYLLTSDTTALSEERFTKTALSAADLAEGLRAIQAQRVVVLIDSCHAGAAVAPVGGVRMRAARRVETDQALVRLARSAGVFFIGGSSRDRLAAEADRFGHGLFTYALLEALGGGAGCAPVTAACLQDWTERRLPALYREIGQGEQYPAIFRVGDDFPLVEGAVGATR